MWSLSLSLTQTLRSRRQERQPSASKSPTAVDLNTITTEEARAIQSEEQKALGYRPPADSLAAHAQHTVDSRVNEAVSFHDDISFTHMTKGL
jgi:hypothetical protein